ncbi:MAG: thioredoxin domain-containing protein [DPANN group archaeon]|nr:thioredoxin domain-containing protein [DPANN group archaeon]
MAHKKDSPKLTTGTLVLIQTLLVVIIVFQLFSIGAKLDNIAVSPTDGAAKGDDVPTEAAPTTAPTPTPTPTPTVQVSVDDDAMKGSPDAKVTIVEFSDYQCPYCERFYSQTLGQIEKNYIDTGKVKLVYRDFPLSFHPHAEKAAEAAECAGEQGKYWEMHNKLFDNQESLGVDNYKKWAGDIGLDQTKSSTNASIQERWQARSRRTSPTARATVCEGPLRSSSTGSSCPVPSPTLHSSRPSMLPWQQPTRALSFSFFFIFLILTEETFINKKYVFSKRKEG